MVLEDNGATRRAGVCLHLTSLPGPHGIGEIGHQAHRFIEFLKGAKLKIWQYLPLGPTAFGDSPYQPLSTFAGNPLLIDMQMLMEDGLLSAAELAPLRELPRDNTDYGKLIPVKNKLLNIACGRFDNRASSQLKQQRDTYWHDNQSAWLDDYSMFRVLKAHHNERAWPEWEPQFAQRDPAALRLFAENHAAQLQSIGTAQFLFDWQWRQLKAVARSNGITLFGDIPIYVALDSADAWACPELLQLSPDGKPERVAGVPPDYFSADGQLWGNPLYDWRHHAATGYDWWKQRLRHALSVSDMIRIDHFRGFESYWAVPGNARTAREGTWEPGPGDEIFDALRAEFGELPIIAEDLGVITAEVEALRERQQLPGMKVLQFMITEPDFSLDLIGDRCACYTGTHDNDTVVGWFNGGPGDTRTPEEKEHTQQVVLNNTGGSASTVHADLIQLAFGSRAQLAIAPMQDYLGLGSEARLNTPGVTSNNWRWRMDDSVMDQKTIERIAPMVANSGRD